MLPSVKGFFEVKNLLYSMLQALCEPVLVRFSLKIGGVHAAWIFFIDSGCSSFEYRVHSCPLRSIVKTRAKKMAGHLPRHFFFSDTGADQTC
jgi:hypothetical protein